MDDCVATWLAGHGMGLVSLRDGQGKREQERQPSTGHGGEGEQLSQARLLCLNGTHPCAANMMGTARGMEVGKQADWQGIEMKMNLGKEQFCTQDTQVFFLFAHFIYLFFSLLFIYCLYFCLYYTFYLISLFSVLLAIFFFWRIPLQRLGAVFSMFRIRQFGGEELHVAFRFALAL